MPVLSTDRDVDLAVAEVERQDLREAGVILEGEGLESVDSLGKRFDPYQHEAVAHVPSAEPEGTVIGEHQKAYRLHDKIIRPALVTVSSGREEKESQNNG